MEHYPAIKKEWSRDSYYSMGKPWKHYARWKKPVTQGHILFNSIHIKHPELENLSKQSVDEWFPVPLKGAEKWWMRSDWQWVWDWGGGHDKNVLKLDCGGDYIALWIC